MTDQEYKRAFALLTEKLGRVPTPRDKEWLELSEQLRRSYLPAEEERNVTRGNADLGTTTKQARDEDSREQRLGGLLREDLGASTARVGTSSMVGTPAGGSPVSNAREGRDQPLSGPGIIQTGEGDRTTPDRPSAPGFNYSTAMVGARGPAGGIYAKCDGCGRVWERERRRGRPSARCGECK